ncbi:MAG: PEP/pyruvate-binding domain-containing protein [Flavobacteriales bacterium]
MKIQFLLFIALVFVGCASSHSSSTSNQNWHKDYKNALLSQADFDSLAGEPLSSKYDDVVSVKVLWNLKDDQLYFIKSENFRYHHEFADKYFNHWNTIQTFNATNYHTNFMQEFCLGNLNYSKNNKSYSLELSSSASYQVSQIEEFYKKLDDAVSYTDNIKLLVSSDYLIKNEDEIDVSKVSVSEFFGDQPFQIINEGEVCGRLVILESEKDYYKINTSDIVVVHGSPTSIPLCKAIISDQVQSPLSHIQLLSRNRKIPSLSISNKKLFDELLENVNMVIQLSVSSDDYTFEKSDSICIEADFDRPEKVAILEYDIQTKELLKGKKLSFKNKHAVGNKAAGVGELARMADDHDAEFSVPENIFAIPFYYFNNHINDSIISNLRKELATIERPYADTATHSILKSIRKRIKELPVSKELIVSVKNEIKNSNYKSFRFRSSCNAEDLEDFNGAGLYTSKTGIIGDTSKTIEKAITSVWASLFNDQAYIERWSKNIDEQTVFMGILVHRNFPDEEINGVAITTNIYRPNSFGITFNLQKGDNKVVSPDENTISELCVIADKGIFIDRDESKIIDFISFSSESPEKPLLTEEQYRKLYDALAQVKTKFYYKKYGDAGVEFNNYSLDIEFKFDNNGKLYLKQVRPA